MAGNINWNPGTKARPRKFKMGKEYINTTSMRLVSQPPLINFTAEEIKKMTHPDELTRVLEDGESFPIGEVVDRCLELGINVTMFCNRSRKNLYHFSAEQGDCAALKKLLDIHSGPINQIDYLSVPIPNFKNIAKNTPLHYACVSGHLEAAKLLVERGANVNIPSMTRRPPLFEAIGSGNKELFEYLLQAGANPMEIDPEGRNALFIAARKGRLEILNRLLAIGVKPFVVDGKGFSLLHIALENAKYEIIQRLLETGIDPNIPCSDAAMRPMDAACCFCDHTIVDLLIRHGAVYNYPPGFNNHTFYYWAVSNKNLDVIKYLLSIGIDPNIPTMNESPLQLAIQSKSIPVVDLFLSYGLNVNAPTFRGDSLLEYPVTEGDFAMVSRLLSAGIDPNYQNPLGKSLLHLAVNASKCSPEIIETLINCGTGVNMTDSELLTPLHVACISENPVFVETLLRKGANPNLTSKDGDNPMDLTDSELIKSILARYGGTKSSCMTKFYRKYICCLC